MTVSFNRSIKLQKSAEVVVLWVNGGKKRANQYREQDGIPNREMM